MIKNRYVPPKSTKYSVEFLGWLFLIGIPLGIWWDEYRLKIIFTSLFLLVIIIILIISDVKKEQKFNEESKNDNTNKTT